MTKPTVEELGIILNSENDIPVHIPPEGKIVGLENQGCFSIIDFPLGQDENAVGMALNNLLDEGWKFFGLSKTHISLSRRWEIRNNAQPIPNISENDWRKDDR